MKKTVFKLAALAMAAMLSSCVSSFIPIQFGGSQDDRTIHQYITDNQYGRAIKALERRIERNPSQRNKIWLLKVKTNSNKYSNQIIAKARYKIKHGKWQVAFVLVDDAIHNYPESKRLNRYREYLSKKQSKSIKFARIKLVSAKSEYLLRLKPVYVELNRLDPSDDDISWKLKKTNLEISETAKSLSIAGAQAVKQNNFKIAQLYLELADQLNPTQENTRALANLAQNRIQRIDRARRRAARRQRRLADKPLSLNQKAKQKKLNVLANQIRYTLMRGNYDKASTLLMKAHNISPDHPDITKLRLALDSSVNRKVSQLVHKGNSQYSKGRIELARRSWTRALKLDPKNIQIKSSVARAERVLSKLREIKNQRIN